MMTLDEDEDTRTVDEVVAEVIAKLPSEIHLHYIDYRDQLTPEQVKEILEDPEDGRNNVADAIWEHFSEYDYESVRYHYEDVTSAEEREKIEEADAEQEVYDAIRERDVSDPFSDLLRSTPNMLFRYDLGFEVESPMTMDDGDFRALIVEIGQFLGIDPDLNAKALTELCANASYGGCLYIAWYTDIAEVLSMDGKTVTFTDPYIVCLDSMNGSGHDVKVDGEVRIPTYELAKVALDHGPYSWTDVCGLYTPAYACGVTVDHGR